MSTAMPEKFYITTAIAYTSQKPHVGNTYEAVFTDAIARYHRLKGDDTYFLTGTDEHGQKIEDCAKAAGVTPQEWVDKIAGEIRSIWDRMGASYDQFIRTTDKGHEQVVQKIFRKLYDQGDIYKGKYEGWYCKPCESFFTETQVTDGRCPDCGAEVQRAEEEAYFFRMSKYADRLMKHIEEHPDFIQPESRKNEMVNNFLKPGLQDLCVSRTSFSWGIPVDFDPRHVVYVWIDALSNYITAIGYDPDGSSPQFEKYWPADVHVIGKDILRFHTIYWPIMLMALGLPLPKQIFGHPWMLFGKDKMSKSKGNVIYADDLSEQFGVDAVRYYMLSEMPFASDGAITYETVIARYNSDLANTLGNLVNRSVAMCNKYFGGKVSAPGAGEAVDQDLIDCCRKARTEYIRLMEGLRLADSLDAIMELARRANKYIDETAPWVLAKEEASQDRLAAVLSNLIETIRQIAVMLQPFMPETAEKIFGQINCQVKSLESLDSFGENGVSQVGTPEALFARIDEAKKLAELAAFTEAKAKAAVQAAPAAAKPEAEQITIEDFQKVSLCTAQITACEKVPKSDKLYRLQLDDGTPEGRQIVSGIAAWYKPEELIGKKIVVVANLKPAKLRGVESRGMLLAADVPDGEGERASVLFVDDSVPVGSRLH
jgi:methionyl-tRNA synthetase